MASTARPNPAIAQNGIFIKSRQPNVGITEAEGFTVPTDGTAGFAPGCKFTHLDGAEDTVMYVNDGTATSCDFNTIPTAVLATTDEINRASDLSTRIVNVTAASLALTLAEHDGKTVTVNAAAGCAITLPAATGSGARFRIFIGTTITSNSTTITRAGSDTLFGRVTQLADGGATLASYELPGSTVITLNGSTTGGIKGDWFEIEDVAAATWHVNGFTSATGSEATPVT